MTSVRVKPVEGTKKVKATPFKWMKGALGFHSKAQRKESSEREKLDKIILRQRLLQLVEIKPQTWSFVYGDEFPKLKKEVSHIVDITPRNLWMESLFIFNQIKALRPDEVFHSPDAYALKWQPPGSSFRFSIPLQDIQVQENVINQLAQLFLKGGSSEKILFYFSPRDPSIPIFAIKVHPSSLVSYKTKIAVLEKLCYFYSKDKFPLADLQQILTCGYLTWKLSLFNFLQPDEQEYHRYLLDKIEPVLTLKKIEEKYQKDEICLQEYSDFKFHERKEKRDIEALTYPRPYKTDDCLICHELDVATIHCPNCANMVCKSCITRYFLSEDTKIGSFICMHRLFCLKKVQVRKVAASECKESAYLSNLRANGREAAVTRYVEAATLRAMQEANDMGMADMVFDGLSWGRSSSIASLETIVLDETPDELQEILLLVDKLSKYYKKLKKAILGLQSSIDKKGHTPQFLSRLNRLKEGSIESLVVNVQNKLDHAAERLSEFNCTQDPPHLDAIHAESEIKDMVRDATLLSCIENVGKYYDKVDIAAKEKQQLLQTQIDQKIVEVLLKFG